MFFTLPSPQYFSVMFFGKTARTGRQKQAYSEEGSRYGEWVLPKGGWETDESEEEAAARETWEEAGAIGRITAHLGEYEHKLDKRTGVPDSIFIFFEMEVQRLEEKWPEMKKRERRWFTFEEARAVASKKVMRKAIERCSLAYH
ncbi:hypothetical protein BGW41_003841 [Actinomortierella wolfii]|nr:hypothetical protein BGW41_003841 [Actinomortierella wolfii]